MDLPTCVMLTFKVLFEYNFLPRLCQQNNILGAHVLIQQSPTRNVAPENEWDV